MMMICTMVDGQQSGSMNERNTQEEENRATAQKKAESTNHSAEVVKCDFYDHPMF